ncbi:MAG: tRNA pseudouridine(38-40) synthase TruA [Acidobacteria bacterium]|nr:tRNA pseudouridine(38-40) synthase TruA [Acidobacteriota bacterium]
MPTYKLTLEYVGTRFAGWQVQPGLPTVQGEILARLRSLFDSRDLLVAGAARTDAGVHARGQVASFDAERAWEPARLRRALNGLLPSDISAREAEAAPPGFHARRCATSRIYRYQIAVGARLSPFLAPFAHHHRGPLDIDAMRRGAARLLGEHDFSAFKAAGDVSSTPIKNLRRSEISAEGDVVAYTVEGNSFLQHMVRTIAGTLLDVGRGHRSEAWVTEVLGSRDRARSGPNLPARGLTLERVLYDGAPPAPLAAPPTR